jgi:histidinol-phosphate phosphatase family protein
MSARGIFLDKDGTLLVDVPYNVNPALMQLAPRACGAIRALHSAGFRLFVVSNQSGVAHGLFSESAVETVGLALRDLFRRMQVPLDGFYYCPHHPQGSEAQYAIACTCRKPEPGMIERAASEHGVELDGSWVIGDILDDVEAGHRAGCRTVLIDNGGETEWRQSGVRRPDYVARDLYDATRFIVSRGAQ